MPLLGIQSLIAGHLSHRLLSYPTSPLTGIPKPTQYYWPRSVARSIVTARFAYLH
jgi:hypothetical protein